MACRVVLKEKKWGKFFSFPYFQKIEMQRRKKKWQLTVELIINNDDSVRTIEVINYNTFCGLINHHFVDWLSFLLRNGLSFCTLYWLENEILFLLFHLFIWAFEQWLSKMASWCVLNAWQPCKMKMWSIHIVNHSVVSVSLVPVVSLGEGAVFTAQIFPFV